MEAFFPIFTATTGYKNFVFAIADLKPLFDLRSALKKTQSLGWQEFCTDSLWSGSYGLFNKANPVTDLTALLSELCSAAAVLSQIKGADGVASVCLY